MRLIQFNSKQEALDFSHEEAVAHGNKGATTMQYSYVCIDDNHYLNITGTVLSTTDYELIDIEVPQIEEEI